MAKRRSGVSSPPPPVEQSAEDGTSVVEPASSLDDQALISSASKARHDNGEDAPLVAELLKRAAAKNRAALDRLAR
jgi:hypothetical protein